MQLTQLLDKLRELAAKKGLKFECQTTGEPDRHDYVATLYGIELTKELNNHLFRAYSTTRLFKTFCVKADSIVDFFDGYFDAMLRFDFSSKPFYKKGFELSVGLLFQKNVEHHALTV